MNQDIEQLIHGALHGELSADEAQRLSAWIAESKDNARAYYRIAIDEQAIDRTLQQPREHQAEQLIVQGLSLDDSGAAEALAELARKHVHELGQPIDFATFCKQQREKEVIERRRRAMRRSMMVAGSIAAMIALVVTVSLVIRAMSGPYNQPIALQDDAPTQTVATLTDAYNAKWAENAFAPGTALSQGQRLTLTHGFAEITTARGAIATFQAPCTIELLDNDNALRLVRGKLVGICETESSKGFLVRTPHMDVTDLGTRFGVDATQHTATEVHVLEGEVRVEMPAKSGSLPQQMKLTRGQAALVQADESSIQTVALDATRFAAITPRRINLFGTGQGLAIGETDPNWQVISMNGQRLDNPLLLKVGGLPGGGAKGMIRNDPKSSQWLHGGMVTAPPTQSKERTFTCRSTFKFPEDVDPVSARMMLQFDADDHVAQIRINGRAFTPKPHHFHDGHTELNSLTIPGPFIRGTNTIELDAVDLVRNSGPLWGFRIHAQLEVSSRPAP